MTIPANTAFRLAIVSEEILKDDNLTKDNGVQDAFYKTMYHIVKEATNGGFYTELSLSSNVFRQIEALLTNNGYLVSNTISLNDVTSFKISW